MNTVLPHWLLMMLICCCFALPQWSFGSGEKVHVQVSGMARPLTGAGPEGCYYLQSCYPNAPLTFAHDVYCNVLMNVEGATKQHIIEAYYTDIDYYDDKFYTDSPQNYLLEAGETYQMAIDSKCIIEGAIFIDVAPGYQVLINGAAYNQIELPYPYHGDVPCGINYPFEVDIQVVEVSATAIPAGEFAYDDDLGVIDWRFGLGTLADGSNAGQVYIRLPLDKIGSIDVFDFNPGNRRTLKYSGPGSGEVTLEYDELLLSAVESNSIRVEIEDYYVGSSSTPDGYDIVYYDLSGSTAVEFVRYRIIDSDTIIETYRKYCDILKITGYGTQAEKVTAWILEDYLFESEYQLEDLASDIFVFRDAESKKVIKWIAPYQTGTNFSFIGPETYMAIMPTDPGDVHVEQDRVFTRKTQYDFDEFLLLEESLDFQDRQYTTTYAYTDDKRPQLAVYPDGNWAYNEYYTEDDLENGAVNGEIRHSWRPFLDEVPPHQDENEEWVIPVTAIRTTTTYASHEDPDVTDNPALTAHKAAEIVEEQDGKTLSRTTWQYQTKDANGDPLLFGGKAYTVVTERDYPSASGDPLVTVLKVFDPNLVYGGAPEDPDYSLHALDFIYSRRKRISMESPDGAKRAYVYRRMSLDSSTFAPTDEAEDNTGWETIEVTGTKFTSGGTAVTEIWGKAVDTITLVTGKSMLTSRIQDRGRGLVREYYYDGSDFILISETRQRFSPTGILLEETVLAGSQVLASYSAVLANGRVKQDTGADGVTTHYYYDYIGRLVYTVREGVPGENLPATYTRLTLDAQGRVRKSEVAGKVGLPEDPEAFFANLEITGGEKLVTEMEYDLGGRKISATAPCGSTSTYDYQKVNDFYRETVRVENSVESVTRTHRSGLVESVTGDVVPSRFSYEYLSSGNLSVTQYPSVISERFLRTESDWLGRTLAETVPTTSGEATTQYDYYASATSDLHYFGKLKEIEVPGQSAKRRYVYDVLGNLLREGLDINGGGLDLSSDDRITEYESGFVQIGNDHWWREKQKVYSQSGQSTAITLAQTDTRLTGFSGNLISEQRIYGPNGAYAGKQEVELNPVTKTSLGKQYIADVTSPAEETQIAGYLVSSQSPAGEITEYTYDTLGRLDSVFGLASSGVRYEYLPGSTLNEKIYEKRDGGEMLVRSFVYEDCGSGRIGTEYDYLNNTEGFVGHAEWRSYAYNERGQVTKVWGSSGNPVYYRYNAHGQRDRMATFHSYSLSGNDLADFDAHPLTTRWAYNARTGLQESETDSSGNTTQYFYRNTDNRLEYLQDPRMNNGQRTRYEYFSTTGELKKVDYSFAGTIDVSYQYDRLGRTTSVTDALGVRTFEYDDDSTEEPGTLQLTMENLPTQYGGLKLWQDYDTSGLRSELKLLSPNGPTTTTRFHIEYERETGSGRMDGFTAHSGALPITHSVDYAYYQGTSAVVSQIDMSGGGHTFRRRMERDPYRLYIDEYHNETVGGASFGSFTYEYPERDRQINYVEKTGELFAAYGSGGRLRTYYGYNSREELTGSTTRAYPTSGGLGSILGGRTFSMSYDDGGNRSSGYTPATDSDQYDFRTNTSTRWITGQAPTVQDVFGKVGSQAYTAATRVADGGYFQNSVQVDNSENYAGAAWIKSGNLERQQALYVPRSQQSFSHDESGNQTGDSVLEYRYDAENRLVAIIYPDGFHREFTYDYRSRRVREYLLHYPSDVTYGMWYYVYDDWRIIAEIDASVSANNGITKTFVWGLDIASSGGAATGNIGGLYGIDDWTSGRQYQVGYDGMGNVSMLIDAQSGKLAAGLEYSAFGELVRASGEYAVTPFRYSTKWHLEYGPAGDHVNWSSDFYDYGLRVYVPSQGRFLNRDPIGDAGGSNLYGFVGNDPVNRMDVLGLEEIWDTGLWPPYGGGTLCGGNDFWTSPMCEGYWDFLKSIPGGGISYFSIDLNFTPPSYNSLPSYDFVKDVQGALKLAEAQPQGEQVDCAQLAGEIADLKDNTLPEVNKLYAERGYNYHLTLAAIGLGSLEVAEYYGAHINNASSIPLGPGGLSLDSPRTATPRMISPAYTNILKWGGRALAGVGTVFSAREALDSRNSTGDRVWATVDTVVGTTALFPYKDPLTSATVGSAAVGYFSGRFINETIDYALDVGGARSSFEEARGLRDYGYNTLQQKQILFNENCK